MPASEAVHLIELRAEGFQRLNAVHVKLSPGGKLLPVSGKNASGKTALLDAIEAALTGTIAATNPKKEIAYLRAGVCSKCNTRGPIGEPCENCRGEGTHEC